MVEHAEVAPATLAAFELLETLVARGLSWVVLCPGARSQALALAAATLEREGRLRLAVRVDERSAAFTALGMGVETGVPAAVITTSGSAIANLFPAVLEAHHAGVPLLLLTADRPPELRGIASNQTTNQAGFFGDFVRWDAELATPVSGAAESVCSFADRAWSAAAGHAPARRDRPGPVHLNLPYREPLSTGTRPVRQSDERATASGESNQDGGDATVAGDLSLSRQVALPDGPLATRELAPGPKTLVVAGADAGERAEECAHAGGWPLIAEVSSGARFGRNLVSQYRAVLKRDDLVGAIERVVVFGHPTLSREIPDIIAGRDSLDTIVVRGPGAEVFNPGHRRIDVVDAVSVAEGESDPEWLGAWLSAAREEQALSDARRLAVSPTLAAPDVRASRSDDQADRRDFAAAELAALRTPLTRDLLVDAAWRATWPHDRLVFGASRLIRVADRAVAGKKIRVHASRGLAGIDGTVSTAAGMALASGALTRVVLGDLTFLHDVGGLFVQPGEERPRLQLVVGNDGGGTIFDSLEVATQASAEDMRRVLYTPQDVRLAALAEAYGWSYIRATTVGELDQALTMADHPVIIEVPLDR